MSRSEPTGLPHLGNYLGMIQPALEVARAGGVGYTEAKALLAEAIQSRIAPAQARHAELMSDPAGLQAILASGANRARKSAAGAPFGNGSSTA